MDLFNKTNQNLIFKYRKITNPKKSDHKSQSVTRDLYFLKKNNESTREKGPNLAIDPFVTNDIYGKHSKYIIFNNKIAIDIFL